MKTEIKQSKESATFEEIVEFSQCGFCSAEIGQPCTRKVRGQVITLKAPHERRVQTYFAPYLDAQILAILYAYATKKITTTEAMAATRLTPSRFIETRRLAAERGLRLAQEHKR